MTSYFDQSAATWDNEPRRIALMKAVGEAILREAGPSSDMDVLDYGCGTGLVSLFLLPHVRSVTGADNSPGMLEVLQKKMAESSIENMKVMHLNLEEGTVPSDRYHLIVISMTMHHVADTAKVIRGFHELLHPGGRLCIADLDKEPGFFHPPEANSSVQKRKKVPFLLSNLVRGSLFFLMLLLLFGIVGGTKGFVVYHFMNPFNLFDITFETPTILLTVILALALALVTYRPYCQFICPFGLVSWLAERVSLVRVRESIIAGATAAEPVLVRVLYKRPSTK